MTNKTNHNWHLIDLSGKTLGRISTEIATILMGKQKPTYTPNVDDGDFVVAINAAQVKFTGKKLDQKMYYRHSGFPGGFRETSLSRQMEKDPRKVIEASVNNMLPKNKLRDIRMRRLKVFATGEHPYKTNFTK